MNDMELSRLRIGALEHMLPESERHRLMEYVKLSLFVELELDEEAKCPKCGDLSYLSCACLHNEAVAILDMLVGITV